MRCSCLTICLTVVGLTALPSPTSLAEGAAVLQVMAAVDDVQRSNFNWGSFVLTNTGSKDIVAFELDVTAALFPDVVFDPEGKAGDSTAKPLTINRDDATGVVLDPERQSSHYHGDGGKRGYERLTFTFDQDTNEGFNPGESLGFSIDMDPNSIAETRKGPLDEGSSPRWDVGGVSGAEMIGSIFRVTFADDTHAVGQLFATGTQAGSQGLATEKPGRESVELRANGLRPGEVGTYGPDGLTLVVQGAPNSLVRVVLAKGFIQPATPYNETLAAQLSALRGEPFPANNAVEFQFADLTMDGESRSIGSMFDLSGVRGYTFKADGEKPFSIDDDKVPLAVTAAVIDPTSGLPVGPVSPAIYLVFVD